MIVTRKWMNTRRNDIIVTRTKKKRQSNGATGETRKCILKEREIGHKCNIKVICDELFSKNPY